MANRPLGINVLPSLVSHTWGGKMVFAEVEPSGSRWLPWRGRTSRWWFEVHHRGEPDEHGFDITTHAYEWYGSGGAFTLRRCMIRAAKAIQTAVEILEEEEGTKQTIPRLEDLYG